MFHKVGEVLLCFRTSRGDHFISFRVFCSIVQPPLPSNQSPITRCHGPLHPQQRGQRSWITCSSFHFHYRRTTPKPVYKGYGAGGVQTEMPWAKEVTLALDYLIRWDYIVNKGRAPSGSSCPIQIRIREASGVPAQRGWSRDKSSVTPTPRVRS